MYLGLETRMRLGPLPSSPFSCTSLFPTLVVVVSFQKYEEKRKKNHLGPKRRVWHRFSPFLTWLPSLVRICLLESMKH